MEFRDTDTELDRKLKLRMLEIYNKRLAERQRRKQFIVERGLLNVKRQQNLDRKRTPQEREIHGAVRVFARFRTPTSTRSCSVVSRRRADSKPHRQLKEYRRAGIHTLSEGEVYDAEKRRRIAEMARLKALEMPAGRQGARANKYLSRDDFAPGAAAAAGPAPKELLKLQGGVSGVGGSIGGAGGSGNLGGGSRKKAPLPMDLTNLPGAELLSKREKEVCVNCRLLPVHYLSIKEALMRASAEGETLKRADVRHMFRIEPVKAIRVFELLLANGWIKTADAGKDASAKGDAGDGYY